MDLATGIKRQAFTCQIGKFGLASYALALPFSSNSPPVDPYERLQLSTLDAVINANSEAGHNLGLHLALQRLNKICLFGNFRICLYWNSRTASIYIMSEQLLYFNRFEKYAMTLYLRCGAVGITVVVTLFSVLASVFASFALMSTISVPAEELNDPLSYIHVAVLVPLIVAPLCCMGFTCLLGSLNNAYMKVSELSTTDPLTGSANRRGFMDAATQNIHTLQEASTCLVGMVDLDDFKLVNDSYGHQVGDVALTCVAKSLNSEISNFGLVGRLGGDEFAFVAFGPSSDLDRLRVRVTETCTRLTVSGSIDISCSIGMVTLIEGERVEDALARADRSLYRIKSGEQPKLVVDSSIQSKAA